MHKRLIFFLSMQIMILVPFMFSIGLVDAQDEVLVLEWEQHWPTYGVGGTCNFGTHNFFVGDVDNDGVIELITGGMTYSGDYHNSGELEAPFGIWNWDGENFTLEVYHTWKGILNTIYAADLDADGQTEIITAGRVANSTTSYGSIGIWSWDNKDLVLRSSLEGLSASSIHVGDLDGDGNAEILTSGSIMREDEVLARLSVLRWENEQLFLTNNYEWASDGRASAKSVRVCDLDNDGVVEVIVCGVFWSDRRVAELVRRGKGNYTGHPLENHGKVITAQDSRFAVHLANAVIASQQGRGRPWRRPDLGCAWREGLLSCRPRVERFHPLGPTMAV